MVRQRFHKPTTESFQSVKKILMHQIFSLKIDTNIISYRKDIICDVYLNRCAAQLLCLPPIHNIFTHTHISINNLKNYTLITLMYFSRYSSFIKKIFVLSRKTHHYAIYYVLLTEKTRVFHLFTVYIYKSCFTI